MVSHYAPTADESKELSLDEWTHVLRLSTMWGFDELRGVAIDNLRPLLENEDPVRWIVLARKYNVHDWLLPAFHALARRPEALQLEKVEPLGIVTIVKMGQIRESFPFNGPSGSYNRRTTNVSRQEHNFEHKIRIAFRDELEVVATPNWSRSRSPV